MLEAKVLNVRNLLLGMIVLAITVAGVSCSSESAETKQLYTDAKDMWDQINRAFTLPKGEERTQQMYTFINDEWDKKIVDKLELYLKESPNGEYAEEAQTLLDEARKSQELRALGQMRAISGQMNLPQNEAEVDSLTQKMQKTVDTLSDTTNTGN